MKNDLLFTEINELIFTELVKIEEYLKLRITGCGFFAPITKSDKKNSHKLDNHIKTILQHN